MEMTFRRADRIRGSVRPPGDKSISHRALIAAAMTGGECAIRGLASGADVASTVTCLRRLGYGVKGGAGTADSELVLRGNGWRPSASSQLDAGNSGTTMRLLTGALAGTSGEHEITGDASLRNRPMGRVAEPLRRMGARIDLSEDDRPPVRIRGAALRGIEHAQPVASAQVKSAILLAGLQAEGRTKIKEPAPSRDHTERLLQWLGAKLEWGRGWAEVSGGLELFEHPGFQMDIPGDLSSAAYFLAAAILSPHGRVQIEGVGVNPSRSGILEIFGQMGAVIDSNVTESAPEPTGELTASSSELKGITVEGHLIPAAIDELPLAALAATQAQGRTVIRDAAELRVKESDRIKTVAVALNSLGASVEEQPDGWIIEGPTALQGGLVDPGGDHRVALTLAVAGTLARGAVRVENWECTEISYPGFEHDLAKLVS